MEQNDSLLKILTYKLPGAVTRPLFTERSSHILRFQKLMVSNCSVNPVIAV